MPWSRLELEDPHRKRGPVNWKQYLEQIDLAVRELDTAELRREARRADGEGIVQRAGPPARPHVTGTGGPIMDDAIKSLRKSVKKADADKFLDGAVIRWKATSGYSGIKYLYAAIRAGGKWYMMGRSSGTNPYYPNSPCEYGDLTEILARGDVSDVEVASGWTSL